MSPIIGLIDDDLQLDHLVLSVIGAAPPLIFALSGLLAPLIARALGLEGSLVALTLLGGIGHLLRAVAPEPGILLLGTVLALLGAGCCNVLLPPVVKRYFPDRIGTVTALYVTVMSLGATVPPIVAVPIAEASSLARLPRRVVPARRGRGGALGLAAGEVAAGMSRTSTPRRAGSRRHPPGSGGACSGRGSPGRWRCCSRRPPSRSTRCSRGFPRWRRNSPASTRRRPGALLGAFAICGVPAALIVPVLAVRLKSVRPLILAGLAFFVAGFAGFLFAPTVAPLRLERVHRSRPADVPPHAHADQPAHPQPGRRRRPERIRAGLRLRDRRRRAARRRPAAGCHGRLDRCRSSSCSAPWCSRSRRSSCWAVPGSSRTRSRASARRQVACAAGRRS